MDDDVEHNTLDGDKGSCGSGNTVGHGTSGGCGRRRWVW